MDRKRRGPYGHSGTYDSSYRPQKSQRTSYHTQDQVQLVPYQPQVQYVQPLQPRFQRHNVQSYDRSLKTVSDIESYMENKRMHEIPSFKPYSYGSSLGLCPIYCSTKEEWNFLVKAIVHRKQLEDVVKALDTDRDEKSTKALVGEVVNYFGTNMEKLHEKSNTQIEHLVKQSESLLDFLKSQSLASSLSLAHEAKISTPPNHHQAPPPQQQTNSPPPQQQILESPSQHQILPSLPQQHSLPPSDSSHACDEDMDHLKAFFQEEKKTDKKNENLVSQDYLSFLTEMLTKDGDSLDFEELKRTCKRVK